jgi:hypothetical protein
LVISCGLGLFRPEDQRIWLISSPDFIPLNFEGHTLHSMSKIAGDIDAAIAMPGHPLVFRCGGRDWIDWQHDVRVIFHHRSGMGACGNGFGQRR